MIICSRELQATNIGTNAFIRGDLSPYRLALTGENLKA